MGFSHSNVSSVALLLHTWSSGNELMKDCMQMIDVFQLHCNVINGFPVLKMRHIVQRERRQSVWHTSKGKDGGIGEQKLSVCQLCHHREIHNAVWCRQWMHQERHLRLSKKHKKPWSVPIKSRLLHKRRHSKPVNRLLLPTRKPDMSDVLSRQNQKCLGYLTMLSLLI